MLESARRFVACADEVWRLQRGVGAECRHFQEMADQGHYGRGGGTRQGIYVAAPSGRLLASANTLDPERVLALLDQGWAAWEALPRGLRRLPPKALLVPEPRWEDSFPHDGLALRGHVRDLGPPDAPLTPGPRSNTDHAWFTADEARRLLPARPRPGAQHPWPRELLARLARFHLVDNVRGQTLPFADAELLELQGGARVTAVQGPLVHLELSGRSLAVSDGVWRLGPSDWGTDAVWPRSVRAAWTGSATYDLSARRFTAFRLVALGTREGRTEVNGRHGDPGPSRLGWVFEPAPERPAGRVAPAFVDVYDAPWIRRPATAAPAAWRGGHEER